jgi:inosine-uridine nucleoside N-ribohydrolase
MRFIIDCDPGHDDALALMLAATYLDVIGITTVFGNTSVANTTRNALALMEAAHFDVPVYAGCAGPLTGPLVNAESVHGKSGLDGADFAAPNRSAEDTDAVTFIVESARQFDDLTVIAPAAEFNVYADPEAARDVFRSGASLRMAGLNVTSTFGIEATHIAQLRAHKGLVARELGGALDFYLTRVGDLRRRNFAPVHDVCAVLPFTHPELIRHQEMHVDVETQGEITRGMTVCDQRGRGASEETPADTQRGNENCQVAISADTVPIQNLIVETLTTLP